MNCLINVSFLQNVTDDLFGNSIFLKHLIKKNGDTEVIDCSLNILALVDSESGLNTSLKPD